MSELSDRLIKAVTIKPTKFIIYDVPYLDTLDNYLFLGFQSCKHGDIALYHGVFHDNTICLSTINELLILYSKGK